MRRAMGIAVFLTPVFYVVFRTIEKRITGRVRPVNYGHGHSVPIERLTPEAAALRLTSHRQRVFTS